jgi:hypothetical protein
VGEKSPVQAAAGGWMLRRVVGDYLVVRSWRRP